MQQTIFAIKKETECRFLSTIISINHTRRKNACEIKIKILMMNLYEPLPAEEDLCRRQSVQISEKQMQSIKTCRRCGGRIHHPKQKQACYKTGLEDSIRSFSLDESTNVYLPPHSILMKRDSSTFFGASFGKRSVRIPFSNLALISFCVR